MSDQTEEQQAALDELAREWFEDIFGPMDEADYGSLKQVLAGARLEYLEQKSRLGRLSAEEQSELEMRRQDEV